MTDKKRPIPPPADIPPFERLVALMKILRGPGGCPWDAKQTHQSLIPYLIEESHEVVDAIESGDKADLKEELGDLLVQFVFHGILAEETKDFNIDESITAVVEKLIRRHPHVFGDMEKPESAGEVRGLWEKQKLTEQGKTGNEPKRLLDGVPKSMPALTRAFRFGEKAGGVGYDWPSPEPILEKICEEFGELEAEIKSGDKDAQAEEIGDLLFVTASLSRKLGIDPEQSLKRSLQKFQDRFRLIEQRVIHSGKGWDSFTLEELDAWWDEAKELERKK